MVYFFLSFIYLCIWFSGFFYFYFLFLFFHVLYMYVIWVYSYISYGWPMKTIKARFFIYFNSIATIEIVSIDKAE